MLCETLEKHMHLDMWVREKAKVAIRYFTTEGQRT